MNFLDAVHNTPDITNCLQAGLKALGRYSTRITTSQPSLLEGSVDLDNCLKAKYQNAPRWDYALSHKSSVYYIEVHPASTSQVKVVIAKLNWLKGWLRHTALVNLKGQSSYHWISTDKVTISKRSKYSRILAKSGVKYPVRVLHLG